MDWRSVAAVVMASVLLAPPVRAQCGAKTTTCRQCHELRGESPIAARPWHQDHAFADLCTDCHGGDGDAADAARAHASIHEPLARPAATCGPCHADADARGAILRAVARRRVEPERADHRADAHARAIASETTPRRKSPRGEPRPRPRALWWSGRRGARASPAPRRRTALGGRMIGRAGPAPPWSPYACGVALGVLVTISVGVFGHRLSGAGAYQQLTAPVGSTLQPRSPYFGHVVRGGVGWDVLVLIGGLWGGFAGSVLSGAFRVRTLPDALWVEAFGPSVARRWVAAFVGATLTSFGAAIAGGCTASLAVSGGAMLSPAAFLFMFGMFAGGIPVARWTLRARRR